MLKTVLTNGEQSFITRLGFKTATHVPHGPVKIWFQNRRMKWKRSKKAQQEARAKDEAEKLQRSGSKGEKEAQKSGGGAQEAIVVSVDSPPTPNSTGVPSAAKEDTPGSPSRTSPPPQQITIPPQIASPLAHPLPIAPPPPKFTFLTGSEASRHRLSIQDGEALYRPYVV
ncbi:hypothetical protein J437_LFUL008345 [Ladona fulva]|uniref:Homeobox domain-containing protein n=1 Tax=Ladona fulva TaxID=123851 RepID=A0A8K0K5M4_LADFU|nr:hypothetical protein J437_LFUL008345 [Ladona fulva]